MLHDFFMIFVPLFVVLDPAGVLPLFLALTEHQTELGRRQIARRATAVAAITGIVFVILGQAVFEFLGVKTYDFQIAGGILLVVLSILDLLSTGKPAVDERELHEADRTAQRPAADISVVPLAIPLIVGPATLTTELLLVATYTPKYGVFVTVCLVALALSLNLLILFGVLYHSSLFVRLLGRQTLSVINKIVMILLAAIAVSLIRRGITSILTELQK